MIGGTAIWIMNQDYEANKAVSCSAGDCSYVFAINNEVVFKTGQIRELLVGNERYIRRLFANILGLSLFSIVLD